MFATAFSEPGPKQVLADLHAEGRLPGWVTEDEVYGRDPGLRAWLRESDQVDTGTCSIAKSTRIALSPSSRPGRQRPGRHRRSDWSSTLRADPGERRYAWGSSAPLPRRHLLVRRSLVPNAKGVRELAFYL